MKTCRGCKTEFPADKLVKLVMPPSKHYFYLCLTCWHKDLNRDSGNYFDNFSGA